MLNWARFASALDEVEKVEGQLRHVGVVKALDGLQLVLVLLAIDQVDHGSLGIVVAGVADGAQVVLRLCGQVKVDDQRHPLHVDAALP